MGKLRISIALTLVLALLVIPARSGFARSGSDAAAWQALAEKLDAGVTINVRLSDRQHFEATFINARPDAVVVQRKSRVPMPVELIPYDSIASMSLVDTSALSRGKAAGIALGAAGAAVGALMLIISLVAFD